MMLQTKKVQKNLKKILKAKFSGGKKQYKPNSKIKQDLDIKLVEFITRDFQPLSVVQDKGFTSLVHALNPQYSIPCRQTVSAVLLPKCYDAALKKMNEILASAT